MASYGDDFLVISSLIGLKPMLAPQRSDNHTIYKSQHLVHELRNCSLYNLRTVNRKCFGTLLFCTGHLTCTRKEGVNMIGLCEGPN